ncbi:MAG: helix-turn-helix domain-containing protein [Treponema sp.]|jgi:AraC-like DNA-binding protein/ligand-binding sensor protein|nr:helix-turn-helix domain-containing protein [Treponema sp.]
MSKLPNIIQRRELEPLLHKANKIARHYEKSTNTAVFVIKPNYSLDMNLFNFFCKYCKKEIDNDGKNVCALMHLRSVDKAKELGSSNIYLCPNDLVYWTSPFYSGERFAGALLSGGIKETSKNSNKIKALVKMMKICADQISGKSFTQKNIEEIPYNSDIFLNSGEYSPEDEINEAFSLDMERMLLANLRRGDTVEARKLLIKLVNIRFNEAKSNLPAFRLRALELAVLLTRATSNPDDINDNAILEVNSRYQKKIKESTSLGEIESILTDITDKMSERIFSFHGVRHFPALRKAERYIWDNYTRKISLREIAKASGLSATYFSTIFKEEMGENLSDYLNRLRIEKAATLLITTNKSISEIAKICGFEDQSWFSKIFKNNTGYTPGKYRDQGSIFGLSA